MVYFGCWNVLVGSFFSLSTLRQPGILPTGTTHHGSSSKASNHGVLHEDDFAAWATSKGIEMNVDIVSDNVNAGGGRELVAQRNLEPGEIAVKVPLDMTIRVLPQEIRQTNEEDPWASLLAQKLWKEQKLGSKSRFEPYLRKGLPQEAPCIPSRWNLQDVFALQNKTLVEDSCEKALQWRTRQLNEKLKKHEQEEYLKLLDLVGSRTLGARVDGSYQLVPVVDIANHAPAEAGGGYFRIDDKAVYLVAGRRGVLAGKAVTLDYGSRTVDDFLLHYGFVPDHCPSDTVSIPLENRKEAAVISWKDCQGYGRGHSDCEIRQACIQILEEFPTTLQQDVDILQSYSATLTEPNRLALQYRIAKKSLLTSAAGIPRFSFGEVLATV